jgi:hypothetical protein
MATQSEEERSTDASRIYKGQALWQRNGFRAVRANVTINRKPQGRNAHICTTGQSETIGREILLEKEGIRDEMREARRGDRGGGGNLPDLCESEAAGLRCRASSCSSHGNQSTDMTAQSSP